MEWRPVVGYEDRYAVSDDGRVWSLVSGKLLIHDVGNGGYHRVTLFTNGKRDRRFVHLMVLEVFRGPPTIAGLEGCHEDGVPGNNALTNLRWDTCSNNNLDKAKHGTRQEGKRNGNSKLTDTRVRHLRRDLASGMTQRAVARKFKISQANVWAILHRNTWTHV